MTATASMARLFAQDSDSDESNNLPDMDCLDDSPAQNGTANGHVHPVTVETTSYQYTSQVGTGLCIHVEHRPEQVPAE